MGTLPSPTIGVLIDAGPDGVDELLLLRQRLPSPRLGLTVAGGAAARGSGRGRVPQSRNFFAKPQPPCFRS